LKALFGPIGLLFAVIGSWLVFRAVQDTRLEERLLQHGAIANGTVTEVVARALRINGVSQWRLRYEFDDYQGRRHVNAVNIAEDEVEEWKPGDTGVVRYDAARPRDAVWVGKSSAS
jgi:hypothetical protein